MVIELRTISEKLENIYKRIDISKCSARFDALADGFFLEVESSNPKYCSFRIEVTPFIFDLTADGNFTESDISHDLFDFSEIAISIASGRVSFKKEKTLLFFSRHYLEIIPINGSAFYMVHNGIIPDFFGKELVYENYLK